MTFLVQHPRSDPKDSFTLPYPFFSAHVCEKTPIFEKSVSTREVGAIIPLSIQTREIDLTWQTVSINDPLKMQSTPAGIGG
jgi:hypothetical protein